MGMDSKYTKHQRLTLVVLNMAHFCNAMCVSIQAPSYPIEAEKKGASATVYGLVFGIYELTIFLFAPFFAKQVSQIGPKSLVFGGTFTAATCVILFGLLDKIEGHDAFIVLSLILRIIQALGGAALIIAGFAIQVKVFPESVASTLATTEAYYGLGLAVGPAVGGFLYQLGDFTTPFAALGSLLFLSALMTICLLPDYQEVGLAPGYSLLKVLKLRDVVLAACTITVAACSNGFIAAMLEPHLRPFHLSPQTLGLITAINGGTCAVTAPCYEWLCDKKLADPKTISLLGFAFLIISFCFIGPAPFIPTGTLLKVTIVGLVLNGLGLGACLVAAFTDAHHTAVERGFPDNPQTYGLIARLKTSTFGLGYFAGPSLGGVLQDAVGFREATMYIVAISAVVGVITAIFICCSSCRHRSEYEQLTGIDDVIHCEPSSKRTNGGVNLEAKRILYSL